MWGRSLAGRSLRGQGSHSKGSAAPAGAPAGPDFTGLTAGSVTGLLGGGGALPTGWSYVPDGMIDISVTQTHTAGGVECITLTMGTTGGGAVAIYYPAMQASVVDDVWRASVHIASITHDFSDDFEYGIVQYDSGDVELGTSSGTLEATAGLKQDDFTVVEPTTAKIRGILYFSDEGTSECVIEFGARLDQVS